MAGQPIETTLHQVPTAPRPELASSALYPPVQLTLNIAPAQRPRTALIMAHPSGNFLQHFCLQPLAEAGFASIGIATRFAGNDSALFMEEVMLDLGGAVRFARQQGFERVVLLGFSGGGAIMAMYQSQAQQPTITATPAGDPPDLREADLRPADAVIFSATHPGRAQVLTEWLDPSVVDERDPVATNPSLDMYNSQNGPPYTEEFLHEYRRAQRDRNERITRWCWAKLDELRRLGGGYRDFQFAVYRTSADPRFLDLSIDPNDRKPGVYRGDARLANINTPSGGGALARCSTLRSWLSQWSLSATNADGYTHARHLTVPVLTVTLGADQGVFPSHLKGYFGAVQHADKEQAYVAGAPHFMAPGSPKLREWSEVVADWLRRKGF
jgi:pimeloyl-ACP methyl ester carboxylesterase